MKIKMMEASFWVALCALLLVNLGPAAYGDVNPAKGLMNGSFLNSSANAKNISDTNSTSSDGGLSSNSTGPQPEDVFANKTQIKAGNGTDVKPTDPSKNETPTTLMPSASPGASTLTTQGPETATDTKNLTDTSSKPTPTFQPSSNQSEALPTSPLSSTPSNHSTRHETSSPTSVLTTQPATTATTAGLPSNSTFNTSAPQETTIPQPSSNTSQSSFGSTKVYPSTTTGPLNSSSTNADSPSQLNIEGGDAHNSPAMDPLLAGLVSAFILAAVIVTLLLFLKFRRRETGPQFQRLQNLPMDDMMEDTPLSMFTY